jgi:hypothetical protein
VIEVTASVKLASGASITPADAAIPIPTKANSPPGPSSRPVSTATGQDKRNSGEPKRLAQQLAEIDVHSDREKEDAEQQTLEGRDRRFDRLAVFRLGEQEPGHEGAERHRQAGLIGNDAGGDDHEQGGGNKEIAGTRCRHQMEQGLQQHAAEHDNHGER